MNNCYIFGYGSLINSNSRSITGVAGKSLAVRVKGIKRSWYGTSLKNNMASVGIIADQKSSCNGVLFPIAQQELSNFDTRETGYYRESLPLSQIEFLSSGLDISEDIWIYFAKQTCNPSQTHPIMQSYVDVIIEGCLEIGINFTEEFIKTTSGWEYLWVDDRLHPRYPRHLDNTSAFPKFDRIIRGIIPDFFNQRKAS